MPPKRLLYPGQLPVFRFEMEPKPKPNLKSKPKPKRIRSEPIRPNIAERTAAKRISMSTLRRRQVQQFDYEAYRAAFTKRYISTISSTDALVSSAYNTLTTIWKSLNETGFQTFPTRRPCMPTFTIKSMIYCTILFACLSFAHTSSAESFGFRHAIKRPISESRGILSSFHRTSRSSWMFFR